MDKRYQVFVSSTYEDLREARQEVMQALLELDCIPAGMELFPAANEDQWTLIRGVIDDCDYYIVVVAGRYGSVASGGVSYTEMEYDYAVSQGLPVIGFLHRDPGTLPANRSETTVENRRKLEAFREKVQGKMCRFWTSPADLGSVVSRSLVKLIRNNPAVGWVRADLLPDKGTAEEMLRLRKRTEELEEQLRQSVAASPRDIQQFAQGDDRVELRFTFSVHRPGDYRAVSTPSSSLQPTWNDVFGAVAPLLIDEGSDRVLKNALDRFTGENNAAQIQEATRGGEFEVRSVSLSDEDFNTIKVQFLALRLIARSTKKQARSVADRNAYWMLTPYGESVMMSLRAIRRACDPNSGIQPTAERGG